MSKQSHGAFRRKFVRSILGLSLSVVIFAGFSAVGNASESATPTTVNRFGYISIVVADGESLWSIAHLVAARRPVHQVMAEIVRINQLDSSDLYAGEKLLVPSR